MDGLEITVSEVGRHLKCGKKKKECGIIGASTFVG